MIFGFLFGFLAGITTCIFIVLIEIWLNSRNIGLEKLKLGLKDKIRQKPSIINISTQKETDVNKLIEENDKKGIDTKLEDIY